MYTASELIEFSNASTGKESLSKLIDIRSGCFKDIDSYRENIED